MSLFIGYTDDACVFDDKVIFTDGTVISPVPKEILETMNLAL